MKGQEGSQEFNHGSENLLMWDPRSQIQGRKRVTITDVEKEFGKIQQPLTKRSTQPNDGKQRGHHGNSVKLRCALVGNGSILYFSVLWK